MNQFSAFEIAAKIKSKELRISDVVSFYISKIKEENPRLNAVIEDNFTDAEIKAQQMQAQLDACSAVEIELLPPLFGVPYSMKEMIAVKNKKSTMGSIHRKDNVATENATVVDRIEKAGGILLGMTNVPEVGFWFECDNVIYGRTNNPYDVRRTPGGSSGGEAAIIAAGASPFGVGGDIGGSIRMPAAFCGIFGHKPSDLIIPSTGQFPIYRDTAKNHQGKARPFAVIGPMARKAKDLYPLMQLLVGPDGIDLDIKTNFKLKPKLQSAEQLKVFSLISPKIHGTSTTDPRLSNSVQYACRYLKELGSSVTELPENTFIRGLELWLARAQSIEGRDFPSFVSGGPALNYKKELLALALGKGSYTFPALLTAMLDQYSDDRSQSSERLIELTQLKEKLQKLLGDSGVLLMPTHPRLAPAHRSTYSRPFDFAYTGIINALGFPSTAVPMGLTEEGLPMGIQVVAAENNDHLCLSVAEWLEEGFGGWQEPKI